MYSTLRNLLVSILACLVVLSLPGCAGEQLGYDSLGRRIVEDAEYTRIQGTLPEQTETVDVMFFQEKDLIALDHATIDVPASQAAKQQSLSDDDPPSNIVGD